MSALLGSRAPPAARRAPRRPGSRRGGGPACGAGGRGGPRQAHGAECGAGRRQRGSLRALARAARVAARARAAAHPRLERKRWRRRWAAGRREHLRRAAGARSVTSGPRTADHTRKKRAAGARTHLEPLRPLVPTMGSGPRMHTAQLGAENGPSVRHSGTALGTAVPAAGRRWPVLGTAAPDEARAWPVLGAPRLHIWQRLDCQLPWHVLCWPALGAGVTVRSARHCISKRTAGAHVRAV